METGNSGRQPVLGIFAQFLRFGLMAWGGPVAQIAMIKRELVEEQRWIDVPRFNRLLAAYQVLPGPEAHEISVHLGMLRGGRLAGLAAGLGFMLPGFLLVLALSWLYTRMDLGHPLLAAVFLGVQIGVVALIVRAVHRIGEHILVDRALWLLAVLVAVAAAVGGSFWITLSAAGLAYAFERSGRRVAAAAIVLIAIAITALTTGTPGAAVATAGTLVPAGSVAAGPLFWSGLKAGLLTFGGAYTAIPFVRNDAVGRGWIGDAQFLDGLALSGLIPAPLIIFATFVGYYAGGLSGALAITAGIFLPAFLFPMVLHDRLERLLDYPRLLHFLEGVGAGVVAIIAVTCLQLAIAVAKSVPDPMMAMPILIGALALIYQWKSKFNVVAVVFACAAAGLIAFGRPPGAN